MATTSLEMSGREKESEENGGGLVRRVLLVWYNDKKWY